MSSLYVACSGRIIARIERSGAFIGPILLEGHDPRSRFTCGGLPIAEDWLEEVWDNPDFLVLTEADFKVFKGERKEGTFVHVVNKWLPAEGALGEFLSLEGEVCFSTFGSGRWFAKRGSQYWGVVVSGHTERWWPGDVFTLQRGDGSRYPTRLPVGNHDEALLRPASADLSALICGPDFTLKSELMALAEKMGVAFVVMAPPGEE